MNNTTRARRIREARGDFDRYLKGQGVDIGAGNDPLRIPQGNVIAWDQPQGDASRIEGVPDASMDFVYSSHCLEHLQDLRLALWNWMRVLKPQGILYVAVPDYRIYEKLNWPSPFNGDHKHSFSLELGRDKVKRQNHWHLDQDLRPLLESLGAEILAIHFEDDGYDYNRGFIDQTFDDSALCQICVISRKR